MKDWKDQLLERTKNEPLTGIFKEESNNNQNNREHESN